MDKYVVRMAAGLANRMLQYTYYLYLKKIGYEVYLDNNYKATTWKMEDIDWERIFPQANVRQASKLLVFKYGGGYNWLDKFRRHYLTFTSKVWISEGGSTPSYHDLQKYRYFIGVFQDAAYADVVKEEALKAFKFAPFEKGSYNAMLENKMKAENSVAIHFRKGKDYMKNENFHNTCTLEYYEKAIALIKSRVDNPSFYVFTDNPQWVKENLKGLEYTLVEGNPAIGWGNHFDMQLMSCCKHNIIANSTYSWWGAFLNPHPDKIVIDPKYWFNMHLAQYKNRENKTACKGWILL
jgi:hypothetical protein